MIVKCRFYLFPERPENVPEPGNMHSNTIQYNIIYTYTYDAIVADTTETYRNNAQPRVGIIYYEYYNNILLSLHSPHNIIYKYPNTYAVAETCRIRFVVFKNQSHTPIPTNDIL